MRRRTIDHGYMGNNWGSVPETFPPKLATHTYEGQSPMPGADPIQTRRSELLREQRQQGALGRKHNGRT